MKILTQGYQKLQYEQDRSDR